MHPLNRSTNASGFQILKAAIKKTVIGSRMVRCEERIIQVLIRLVF